MLVWYFFPSAEPFFRGRSLNRDTPVLVPEGETRVPRSVEGGRM